MEEIVSRANGRIKQAAFLAERREREQKRRFCFEGVHLLEEYLKSGKTPCELFVTRLRNAASLPVPGTERTVTEYRPVALPGRQVAYAFGRMDCLLGCCAALCRIGYPGSSSAYVDPSRRTYYLLLDRENPAPGEHLGSLCPSETVFYINEHCDALCVENAAEKLGPLAHYS